MSCWFSTLIQVKKEICGLDRFPKLNRYTIQPYGADIFLYPYVAYLWLLTDTPQYQKDA